jgi:hypothetical protein
VQRLEERELPLVHLPAGPIGEIPDSLASAIQGFQPLPFEPARKAAEWLDSNLRAGRLPMDTYLVLSEDSSQLLGFFVLEPMEVFVSRGDQPILELRHKLDDPSAAQSALRLVWLARSALTTSGFGQELFDEVLVKAVEADTLAVLVEPYDETTAQRIWIDHFQFRTPRPNLDRPEEWTYLWHAVRTVEAEWP